MSMEKTAKLNDRTMEYYEKYDKLIKKLDNNFTKENVKNMRDELQILQENTEDEWKKCQGSMLDYLDNYTVDHNQITMTEDNKIHDGKWIEDDKKLPD